MLGTIRLAKNSKNVKNVNVTPETERICLSMISDEFHKLAESSKEQSRAMKAVLSDIRESAAKIKKSTNEIARRFDALDSDVTVTRVKVG